MANPQKPWWQDSVIFFTRVSSWIVGPVLLALLVGHWVEQKWGTPSWTTLVVIMIGFILSCFGIVRETLAHVRKIQQDGAVPDDQSNDRTPSDQ